MNNNFFLSSSVEQIKASDSKSLIIWLSCWEISTFFFLLSRPRTGTHFTSRFNPATHCREYIISLKFERMEAGRDDTRCKSKEKHYGKRRRSSWPTFQHFIFSWDEMRCMDSSGRGKDLRSPAGSCRREYKNERSFFLPLFIGIDCEFSLSHSEQCSRRTPIMSCWLTTCEMPSRCFL